MRIPSATYRLQFHKDSGFSQAMALADYFHELGITDLYASPIFKARPGSLHGYDVVDPNQLNSELGTPGDFDALARELQRREMGWLQDIVPNHMAYHSENRMLMDILENGPSSPYAEFFDIDWSHPYESIRGKVLAPCLGQFYGQCLESGEIVLKYDAQGLSINYYEMRFPVNVESYNKVFGSDLVPLRRKLGSRHPDYIKLLGILYTLKYLPASEEVRERADQITFVKNMLWELYNTSAEIKAFVDDSVACFNGRRGIPESFNALDQLLGEQYYRLSFWKVATEEINYRRFFNINELISLRMEDERVFEVTHALIFRLLREEKVTGLRIDHIDGLYNPVAYLKNLRQKAGDCYVVVEKILDLEEDLPEDWPVCGTTGYDFTNYVTEIFCQNKNERRFSELYRRFTGFSTPYADLVSEKKRLLIGKHMAGDVDGLALLLKRISSRDRFGGDITLYGLRRALVEVLTFFPVYRSYITREAFGEEDRARIGDTLRKAKESNPGLLHELSFIEKFLLLEHGDHVAEEEKSEWVHFVMRFQQLTGPLMAKGFEDTTLYVYNRLLSLNEVGGNPGKFGISAGEFHEFNRKRALQWPHVMNATATHDTKRGEDVRARINVLSEIPEEWDRSIRQWSRINRKHKSLIKGREVPDSNDEYFLYQSLIGAWPFSPYHQEGFRVRVKDYMIKAVREAKVHTEWLKPDIAYEEAFLAFIDKVLEPSESNPFLREISPLALKVAQFGAVNSLSQTLLKIASPGLPDFYQGTELWDLNFVDPDNRRPVDFRQRIEFLKELQQRERSDRLALVEKLLANWHDGKVKLFVLFKSLNFRRSASPLFQHGSYLPLYASGKKKENVCAFARRDGGRWALIVAPRYATQLAPEGGFPLGETAWGDAGLTIPQDAPDRWANCFTGESLSAVASGGKKAIPLRDVFRSFPAALLTKGDEPS